MPTVDIVEYLQKCCKDIRRPNKGCSDSIANFKFWQAVVAGSNAILGGRLSNHFKLEWPRFGSRILKISNLVTFGYSGNPWSL